MLIATVIQFDDVTYFNVAVGIDHGGCGSRVGEVVDQVLKPAPVVLLVDVQVGEHLNGAEDGYLASHSFQSVHLKKLLVSFFKC